MEERERQQQEEEEGKEEKRGTIRVPFVTNNTYHRSQIGRPEKVVNLILISVFCPPKQAGRQADKQVLRDCFCFPYVKLVDECLDSFFVTG